MVAILDQVMSSNKYKKCILKDPNITKETCIKCPEKAENIRHIAGACRALTQGELHPSSQSSNQYRPSRIGYQMWTIKGKTNNVLKV
jgi:hypothetical protein